MKRRTAFFVVLLIALILIVIGAARGDLSLIFNFGRFICFDCIGIS